MTWRGSRLCAGRAAWREAELPVRGGWLRTGGNRRLRVRSRDLGEKCGLDLNPVQMGEQNPDGAAARGA